MYLTPCTVVLFTKSSNVLIVELTPASWDASVESPVASCCDRDLCFIGSLVSAATAPCIFFTKMSWMWFWLTDILSMKQRSVLFIDSKQIVWFYSTPALWCLSFGHSSKPTFCNRHNSDSWQLLWSHQCIYPELSDWREKGKQTELWLFSNLKHKQNSLKNLRL